MSSLFRQIGEQERQTALQGQGLDDSLFLQTNLYFFELRLPLSAASAGSGVTQSYLFPLVLGPQSYSMTEPFSVEPSYGQNAGLFVEENGIVSRTIRLRGNTGFAPKAVHFDSGQMATRASQTASFSRQLKPLPASVALSGQRHFHYLQDAIFRTYADYKRDAALSASTSLLFHVPHDDEHWLVVPRQFTLDRASASPHTYSYDIELMVIDKGTLTPLAFSEDKGFLDQLRDVLHTVGRAVSLVSGSINDVTAFEAVLAQTVGDVATLVRNVTTVLQSLQNFANGFAAVIQSPISILAATQQTLEQSLATMAAFDAAGRSYSSPGPSLRQSLRNLVDAFDMVRAFPANFQTPATTTMTQMRLLQQGATSLLGSGSQASASAPSTTTSAQAYRNAQTPSALPGDAARLSATSTAGQSVIPYTGARQYVVQRGDTLVNLAARFLGDARRWQYLAIANGLRPPLLDQAADQNLANAGDDTPLGAVLGVGRSIIIPDFSVPPEAQVDLPVLGVSPEAPAELHFLGTDLAMAPVGAPTTSSQVGSSLDKLDLVLKVDSGGTDVATVAGIANLCQALVSRLSIERGRDPLYQALGLQPVVAVNNTVVDLVALRFRVQDAIGADPRVASVASVVIQAGTTPDAAVVAAEVVVRGQTAPTGVKVGLTQP